MIRYGTKFGFLGNLCMTNNSSRVSVAVIIVNYGTPDLALAAVESVLSRTHGGRSIEVHLVDNASPGDDAAIFSAVHEQRAWGDRVSLYLETVNHGFGIGNNTVIQNILERATPPDYVFLLNPDATLQNEAISILVSRSERDSRIGFAGASTSYPDGELRVAAFRFPSIIGEFLASIGFGPIKRLLQRWDVILPADSPEGYVDWVMGAALLIRVETLREIGLFDRDFFLYYEEVELIWRGAQAGWNCCYVPEARVIHAEGAATKLKSDQHLPQRRPEYWYASWRFYFLKTHGRIGAISAALAKMAGTLGNRLISRLRRRPDMSVPYFFADFWRYSLKPLLRMNRE